MGIGWGEPSIVPATSLALGARSRKGTVRSACTSGETTGGGGVWAATLPSRSAAESRAIRRAVFFMSSPGFAAALPGGGRDVTTVGARFSDPHEGAVAVEI